MILIPVNIDIQKPKITIYDVCCKLVLTNNLELVARLEEAALNGLPTLQTEFYDG